MLFRSKKLCNAFITDAVVNRRLGGAAVRNVEAIGSLMGGLWVGGTVTVSADALDWVPNIMNKAVHDNLQPVHIPLREVRAVRRGDFQHAFFCRAGLRWHWCAVHGDGAGD